MAGTDHLAWLAERIKSGEHAEQHYADGEYQALIVDGETVMVRGDAATLPEALEALRAADAEQGGTG